MEYPNTVVSMSFLTGSALVRFHDCFCCQKLSPILSKMLIKHFDCEHLQTYLIWLWLWLFILCRHFYPNKNAYMINQHLHLHCNYIFWLSEERMTVSSSFHHCGTTKEKTLYLIARTEWSRFISVISKSSFARGCYNATSLILQRCYIFMFLVSFHHGGRIIYD